MNTLKRIWEKSKVVLTPTRIIVGLVVLGIVFWQIFKPAKPLPRYTVDKGVVERVVIASGKVEVSDQVNLGFQQAGTVSSVLVKSGTKVRKGQLLARLDLGTLSADLREARANLTEAQFKKSRSQLDSSLSTNQLGSDTVNAAANLEALRIKLLSSDLELSPEGTTSTTASTSPIVSGTYTGKGESAVFSVNLYASSGASGISARVVGEGVNSAVALSSAYPTPIGSTGLYLKLPSETLGLSDTKWKLELPNTRSAQYSANLYQFLDAKKNYENSIKSQSKEISLINKGYNGLTEYDIAIERVNASVDRVNQSIRLRGIYAPVDGTVGRIDLKVGQSVSVGADVITVLGKGKLETKLKVPESSVGGIHLDDPVTISPDIDAEEIYQGVISTINQSETYIEGTPVYETTVIIDKSEALKPGMTVRGKITTNKVQNTLRIPESALFTDKDGKQIVKKFLGTDNKSVDVPVEVTLKGTDGFLAIKADLLVGDSVQLQEVKK